MYKLTIFCCNLAILLLTVPIIRGQAEDFKTGVIMAAAQAKEVFDNGAAARHGKSIEIFGAKFKNDMEIGFGDAMKHKRSADDSDDSSESSSSESEERRRKRSINLDSLANDIKAMYGNL